MIYLIRRLLYTQNLPRKKKEPAVSSEPTICYSSHLFRKPDSCCHFSVNSTIFWCLPETESRPAPGDVVEEMPLKDVTDTSGKLTKDKIHVEELCLPEIMIPMTKTKGNN